MLQPMTLRKMSPSRPVSPTAAAPIARFWGEIRLSRHRCGQVSAFWPWDRVTLEARQTLTTLEAGAQVAVPYARASDRCAVRALQAWLRMAGIHRGPVFRRMR